MRDRFFEGSVGSNEGCARVSFVDGVVDVRLQYTLQVIQSFRYSIVVHAVHVLQKVVNVCEDFIGKLSFLRV